MSKLNITLDVTKFNKAKIVDRVYTTRGGEKVTKKEYKVEVVPLKEPKFVTEGATFKLIKTHFVVEAQTKEERAAKAPSVYVGEGFVFESKGAVESQDTIEYPDEQINTEDIPF